MWVTLGVANAIARIDPALARPGYDRRHHDLPPAALHGGDLPQAGLPGAALAPLSRIPLQMRLWEDGNDDTSMAFTEQAADAIGLARFSPSGTKLNEVHLTCDCLQPLGVALDPSGDIWFTEGRATAWAA